MKHRKRRHITALYPNEILYALYGQPKGDEQLIKEAQIERDMKDTSIPYVIDETTELYHLKNCSQIKGIPLQRLTPCRRLSMQHTICKQCYRKAIIMEGMEDEPGKIFAYMNFFKEHMISSKLIRRIVLNNKGTFQIQNQNSIRITLQDKDTFLIDYCQKEQTFVVYHNNWKKQNDSRYILPGYHLEECSFETLEDAMTYVGQYSYEKFHNRVFPSGLSTEGNIQQKEEVSTLIMEAERN